MSRPAAAPPSSAFLQRFRARADAQATMTFADFMALALYDPAVGYYRAPRPRVGTAPGTDFFTATTSGPLFGELLVAACHNLLADENLADFAFVEIGAEPGRSVLAGVTNPFRTALELRLGDALALRGPCVVFSNELFDAQPCRRFVARAGQWHEILVQLRSDDSLVETESLAPAVDAWLPAPPAREGYRLDAPRAAAELARAIAAQSWSGLFLACDYGKSWRELAEETPGGTCRAYFRHTQSNDLLAQPGAQDLTCHVCWDWIADALAASGFGPASVESQEAFFVHRAGGFIARLVARESTSFSPRKRSLLQLLHPAHLGQKFQVLAARRR